MGQKQSRMSAGVASDLATDEPAARWQDRKSRNLRGQAARDRGMLLVCLAANRFERQVLSAIPLLDFRWAAFAILVAMLEIPLLGLRWRNIVDALAVRNERMTRTAMIAVTAIGVFFAQVLPSVAGDGVRAWLLVRLGCDWRNAVTSVVIDRGVGVGLLIALGICHSAVAVRPHCAWRISRGGARRIRRGAPRRRARSLARAEDRFAARSVAIFPLVRNVCRRRSIAFFSGRRVP